VTTFPTTAQNSPCARAAQIRPHFTLSGPRMFFFGYRKWFPYQFERLVPFISNGPLIWWLHPVHGHASASYFVAVSGWTLGTLLLAGFWDKRLGVLGALGSTGTLSRRSPSFRSCRRVGRRRRRIPAITAQADGR
jgi:hypothetical protein